MTMARGDVGRQETDVASHVDNFRRMLAELRRQTDASVAGLHTIRARTSKVLAATEAFTVLSLEIGALTETLWSPLSIARLNGDSVERAVFNQQLRLLIDQLDAFRVRYASELSQSTPPPPKPKKPWWYVFK